MKKWQKTVGIIVFALIAIYELLIWVNAYVDMKYIVESNGNNFLTERMYMRIGSLSFGMWLNFNVAELCIDNIPVHLPLAERR